MKKIYIVIILSYCFSFGALAQENKDPKKELHDALENLCWDMHMAYTQLKNYDDYGACDGKFIPPFDVITTGIMNEINYLHDIYNFAVSSDFEEGITTSIQQALTLLEGTPKDYCNSWWKGFAWYNGARKKAYQDMEQVLAFVSKTSAKLTQ